MADVLLGRACRGSRELARPVPAPFVRGLRRACERAGGFVQRCLAEVLARQPRIVEFTSVFQANVASRFAGRWTPGLFLETARGCSWGQKSHCTFCGLNGTAMTYRSKSPRRALGEIRRLVARHPESDVRVVDNILDTRYFESLSDAVLKLMRKGVTALQNVRLLKWCRTVRLSRRRTPALVRRGLPAWPRGRGPRRMRLHA